MRLLTRAPCAACAAACTHAPQDAETSADVAKAESVVRRTGSVAAVHAAAAAALAAGGGGLVALSHACGDARAAFQDCARLRLARLLRAAPSAAARFLI